MKTAKPPLWARSKQGARGGPGTAHVEVRHLANLLLALQADPLASSVATVAELRDMVRADVPGQTEIVAGATLGEALDNLVEAMSTELGRDGFYARAGAFWPLVVFGKQGARRTVTITFADKPQVYALFEARQRQLDAQAPLGAPLLQFTANKFFIEALGELAADSRMQMAKVKKSSSGAPETKEEGTPASAPSSNSNQATTTTNRRSSSQAVTDNGKVARESGAFQASPAVGGGSPGSPPFPGGPPHHGTTSDPAIAAGRHS